MSEQKIVFNTQSLKHDNNYIAKKLLIDNVSRVITTEVINNIVESAETTTQINIYDFTSMERTSSEASYIIYSGWEKGGATIHETAQQIKYYDELLPDSQSEFHTVADEVIKYYKEKCGMNNFQMPKAYQAVRKEWDEAQTKIDTQALKTKPNRGRTLQA